MNAAERVMKPAPQHVGFRWPCFLAVLATLLLSGWVHGLRSGRWRPDDDLLQAVARVDEVPMEFGGRNSPDWTAEAVPMDEQDFVQAGALGYWARRYTHRRTKHSLLVILMCGRAGRMSVHTPEVCYQGAGFSMIGAPRPWTVSWQGITNESSATLWTAQFRKDSGMEAPLRLFWAWNSRGTWQALAQPRWETKGEPFLYKMYIVQDAVASDRAADGSPAELPEQQPPTDVRWAQEFLREFLPKLEETLYPRTF